MKQKKTHTATDNAGMVLCTSGCSEVLLNGNLYRIERGMLYFYSPLILVYELSHSDDYRDVVISDSIDVFYQTIKSVYNMIITLRLRNNPCIMLNEEHQALFLNRKKLIDDKLAYLATVTDDSERNLVNQMIKLIMQENLLEFIHLFYLNRDVKPVEVEKGEATVFKFIYLLNQNYKNNRLVSFYAREVGLSISHFNRLVKKCTGRPPSDWIATITLANAKLLLKQSGISIKEIAAELNFPEQFTFRKFFKNHEGISPKQFRLQHRRAQ